MRLIFVLAIALLLVAGCAQNGGGIPKSVSDKYDDLAVEYSAGLGATLSSCNGQSNYIVVGSGGFSGVTYIYDGKGNLLAQYSWDDMVEPGETPPPYDSEKYDCKLLNESKPVHPPPGAVPSSVSKKYGELSVQYSQYLGAFLERCEGGSETVYIVTGSGGFSGVSYYYSASGVLFAEFPWDDVVAPNDPEPPIDRSDYTCTELERSKPA